MLRHANEIESKDAVIYCAARITNYDGEVGGCSASFGLADLDKLLEHKAEAHPTRPRLMIHGQEVCGCGHRKGIHVYSNDGRRSCMSETDGNCQCTSFVGLGGYKAGRRAY